MSIKDFKENSKSEIVEVVDFTTSNYFNRSKNIITKIVAWLRSRFTLKELYSVCAIILIGLAGYGLGKIAVIEKNKVPITIDQPQVEDSQILQKEDNLYAGADQSLHEASSTNILEIGKYVASKNGKKFYIFSCTQVKRISQKNRIWFNSIQAAEAAGYDPATNCKFMK